MEADEKKIRGAIRRVTRTHATSFSGFGVQWTLERRCSPLLCGHVHFRFSDPICLFLHAADRKWFVNGRVRHPWRRWPADVVPGVRDVADSIRELAVEMVMSE